ELKQDNTSIVHTGLSDSSDDEDNKYFEDAKYNECGRAIKNLLKNPSDESNTTQNANKSWISISKSGIGKQLSLPEAKATSSKDIFVDPFFGIRVINPLIPSTVIQERMVGRESVSMAKLKWFLQKLTPEKDWVIAGVIVQKSASKTSQKGNQFSIWSLSDLHANLKTTSLFLFGKAYQNLWKTVVGTVVAVLNPNVLDKKDGSKDEACLSVDNHQKVMILGQSKDFGICKSTKKSGEPCTAFININECEFCIYHLKQEYQKFSKRSEMQSTFQGGGLTALRNKVLGKNEVFYAGKSYTAIPAKRSKKLTAKDEGRLKSLKSNVSVNSNQLTKSRNLSNRKMTASRVELNKNQRAKDLALLQKLGLSNELAMNLDKKIEFSGNLSKEVTLDESKQTALNVICRLRENNANNQGQSSKFNEGSNSQGIASTGELSKEIRLEESKETPLNVINKLKDKNKEESKDISKKNDTNAKETVLNSYIEKKLLTVEDAQKFLAKTSKEIDLEQSKESITNSDENLNISNGFIETKEASGALKSSSGEKTDEIALGSTKPTNGSVSEHIQTVPNRLQSSKLNKPVSGNNTAQNLVANPKPSTPNPSTTLSNPNNHFRPFINPSATPLFLNNHGKTTIDLDSPVSKKLLNQAKLNALKYVKKNGQIKKLDSMSTKGTRKKRSIDNTTNPTPENDPKRQKIQENEFFSERFKKMMAATSSHTDLLEKHDEEQQEKYFKKLEIKEKMEEKMANTFKIECKAVRCLKCKYTSFSAAERCKLEKHPLKVFDSFKRFFKCGNCGNRTVCLEVVPIVTCKNCGSAKWERTSMMKERNVQNLHTLSIRG
ncbi:hypothetical protein AMK59_5204, partial [Oryctes borbonicus]